MAREYSGVAGQGGPKKHFSGKVKLHIAIMVPFGTQNNFPKFREKILTPQGLPLAAKKTGRSLLYENKNFGVEQCE